MGVIADNLFDTDFGYNKTVVVVWFISHFSIYCFYYRNLGVFLVEFLMNFRTYALTNNSKYELEV